MQNSKFTFNFRQFPFKNVQDIVLTSTRSVTLAWLQVVFAPWSICSFRTTRYFHTANTISVYYKTIQFTTEALNTKVQNWSFNSPPFLLLWPFSCFKFMWNCGTVTRRLDVYSMMCLDWELRPINVVSFLLGLWELALRSGRTGYYYLFSGVV